MSTDRAGVFMAALQQIEQSKDVTPLVELFADDAALENPARSIERSGRDGASQFWKDYLAAFDQVHSEFLHVHQGENFAILEWRSEGQLPSGTPIGYRGVSIVEWAGKESGKVQRFCTYYDSASFLQSGSKHPELQTAQ